jgi:hypothetical protein
VLEWWSNAAFEHYATTLLLHFSEILLWDRKLIRLDFDWA